MKRVVYALYYTVGKSTLEEWLADAYTSLMNTGLEVKGGQYKLADVFFAITDNFGLMVLPRTWSPHDICGAIQSRSDDSGIIMPMLISEDRYIPTHGLSRSLSDQEIDELRNWIKNAESLQMS